MSAVIYTKENCSFCVEAKRAFSENNIQYQEIEIGRDIIVEEFKELFPDQRTVPLIFIEGEKIGGFKELVEWIRNRKSQQLLEG